MERLQRERGVAHPRVAVVPVALAARGLRQRGRRGRHGRTGGHVGEALDRQCRALDRLAPAVVGETRPVEPLAPERRRRDDRGVGLVHVGRRRQPLRPRQRAVRPLALAHHVAGTRAVALDADRQVRLQADRRPGAGRVGDLAGAVDERPLGGGAAVVEHRLAHELELDAPLDALDRPHEEVLGVLVGRRPRVRRDRVLLVVRAHHEGVAHHEPAGRRVPGGRQDVRPRHVGARRRGVDAEGAEAERSRAAVQERAEHARGVEAGDAEPVDRAVRGDQGRRVAVRQERVVGDRRERREWHEGSGSDARWARS